jgi:hypothetical protein
MSVARAIVAVGTISAFTVQKTKAMDANSPVQLGRIVVFYTTLDDSLLAVEGVALA